MKEYLLLAFLVLVLPGAALSQESFYRSWDMGPSHDPSYYPIGVWLQDPRDASAYKAAGINLYVGLWEGPTLEQLQALKLSGMRVICPQNETGLEYRKEGIIAGWLHRDEPDNAQPRRSGFGYGSPIPPAQVEEEYLAMKKADPSRPVLLNLGQGAAWDGWWGRGSRSGHFEDYAEYVKGGDIISFDIYPVAHSSEKVAGKLELIGQGVERLSRLIRPPQVVWSFIECTGVKTGNKPTPEQIRSEVWMALVHGARGIVYFAHEWKPAFSSRALLKDTATYREVTRINQQVHELAAVLNSPEVGHWGAALAENPKVHVAARVVKHQEGMCLLSISTGPESSRVRFLIDPEVAATQAEELWENRQIAIQAGAFEDQFTGYQPHIYRLK